MSSYASYGLVQYMADLGPWLICACAVLLNLNSVYGSKTASISTQLRRYWWKIPTAAEVVHMLFPLSVATLTARPRAKDPVLEELHACAARQRKPGKGVQPVLTLLRDLSIAQCLLPVHCMEALAHLRKQRNLKGVQGVLMLMTCSGVPLTNAVVTNVVTALCECGGDQQAVEVYADLTTRSGDYYLDAPVLEALIRSAARISKLTDVERIFKHLMSAGRPSVKAYAFAIHALGAHGAVNDAVNLFEDLMVRHLSEGRVEDVSLAWNGLLATLTRNCCKQRAIAVFDVGRRDNFRILPCVSLALCQMAPDEMTEPSKWIPDADEARAYKAKLPNKPKPPCPRQKKKARDQLALNTASAAP